MKTLPDPGQFIRTLSLNEGFDAVGITSSLSVPDARHALTEFLAQGFHGDMGWLESRAEQRANAQVLWPDARSAIVLGLSYAPDTDPLTNLPHSEKANISVYARGADYHDVIKKRLKKIARTFAEKFDAEVKVFVDTAPVMEKPLAQLAGLGWQGKHTNLVSRTHGSWLFLGVILTSKELEAQPAEVDHCGTCRQCLDACPTKAFPAPYKLDARRCISYLTIEHKGSIPHEFRSLMGNRIYGCDDCLAVCPWNKFARQSSELAFHSRPGFDDLLLNDLARLTDAGFRELFRGSPVKRIGRDRFLRNILIAIGNSGRRALADAVPAHLSDPSPLVRGAAVWALRRLLQADELLVFRKRHEEHEQDPEVLAEWSVELAA